MSRHAASNWLGSARNERNCRLYKPEAQASVFGVRDSLACASGLYEEESGAVQLKRSGFSLIELITAMLASTVLIASLASTVVISTKLLEVPPSDEDVWHDREIADRLANDLRYATSVDEAVGFGFEITKPDSASGAPETATYESYIEGLTRQVGSGPLMKLDSDAPGHQFLVDGYSAPTVLPSSEYARLRSSSTATTSAAVANVDIDLPPGCKTGDLVLLCVSAKTWAVTVSDAGWQPLRVVNVDDLYLFTYWRSYDLSASTTSKISVTPNSSIAAAMIAIENVEPTSPIDWTGTAGGQAWWFLPTTHPTPLETTGFTPRQLNVQIFAAEGGPWNDGTLGMAGFTDAVQATAARGDPSISSSIGIAIRNGSTPDLSTTPRLMHQVSGVWLQTAVRVEATP